MRPFAADFRQQLHKSGNRLKVQASLAQLARARDL